MVAEAAKPDAAASYAPLQRLQQKAALLRAELQSGSPDTPDSPGPKSSLKGRPPGSVVISPGSDGTLLPLPSLPSKPSPLQDPGFNHSSTPHIDAHTPSSPTGSMLSRRSLSPKKSMAGGSLRGLNSVHRSSHEVQSALGHRINVLEQQLVDLQAQHTQVCSELEARQESYMRREDAFKSQIAELEAALQRARGERGGAEHAKFGSATATIMELHGKVEAEIEALLAKQQVNIKHEEQTQTRRLKNQLAQIEAELGAERGAQGRSDAEWLARTQSLRRELDTVQEVANKLDAMYKLSDEECKRLRAQFKCQEDDREMLVRQVVGLKKENKRLAVELAALAAEAATLAQERDQAQEAAQAAGAVIPHQTSTNAMAAASLSKATVQVKIQRYEDVIESLKKVCEAERKRTRQARAAHLQELTARTELQMVLRQCVEDVRKQQAQVVSEGTAGTCPAPAPDTAATHVSGAPPSVFRRSESAGFSRPRSAMPASSVWGKSSVVGSHSQGNRPSSAVIATHSRPLSAVHHTHTAAATRSSGLDPAGRAALMADLQQQEKLLVRLLESGFPTVTPPSLPAHTGQLDRIAQVQDAREAAVVAQARMLGTLGRTGGRDAAPGNQLATKPWVLNVDAMMTEFLTT